MNVGILAFHGDVAEHREILESLKVSSSEVRSMDDLSQCTHLIIPGGESTVMSRFLFETGLSKEIQKRAKDHSLPIYGTCAGAILLAKKVTGKNAPRSLELLNIAVDRNAYGSQFESFQADINVKRLKKSIPVSFIRAPIITKIGKGVDVLATHGGHPVLVRQGNMLAGTFHPEVRDEAAIHRIFLKM